MRERQGPGITKEIMAKRWGIGLDTAHRTLIATMQQGIRHILAHPVERRYYRTHQPHLRFPTLNTHFYTTQYFPLASHCMVVISLHRYLPTALVMIYLIPCGRRSRSEAGEEVLNEMIRTIGVPRYLVSDGAGEETGGCFVRCSRVLVLILNRHL
jgi:hypothetical protein